VKIYRNYYVRISYKEQVFSCNWRTCQYPFNTIETASRCIVGNKIESHFFVVFTLKINVDTEQELELIHLVSIRNTTAVVLEKDNSGEG
jgi:hypothetical protein